MTDRCGGTGEFFLTPEFTVVRSQILAALCDPAWSNLFRANASVRFELGERLTISNDEHIIVARHFESVSQTGPVERANHLECDDDNNGIEAVTGQLAADIPTPYTEVDDLLAALDAGEVTPLAGAATEANLVVVRGVGEGRYVRAWYSEADDRITLVVSMQEVDAGGWAIAGWQRCARLDD